MALHHYLPATFLASFSRDTATLPRRNRHICVGDKHELRTFTTSVANVAAINNLYTLSAGWSDSNLIEKIWSKYETDLEKAIELLILGEINARLWSRVLVPFVACMLVRGPDFNKRFVERFSSINTDQDRVQISEDNINGARLLELQRLLGPVTVAKWVVIRITGSEPLITNDLGYAPFVNTQTKESGIAVPLNLNHVLAIIPRLQGRIAMVKSGNWIPDIEFMDSTTNNEEGLNQALSSMAQRYIFGPSDAYVTKWLQNSKDVCLSPEPYEVGFITDPLARAHEFTWHRLAAALERDPLDDTTWDFPLDWERLAKGWIPAVFFPTNLIEFPPALHRQGNSITAEFYNPEVYYSISRLREFEQDTKFDLLLKEATKGLELAQNNAHKVIFLVARAAAYDEFEKYDEALRDYNEALTLEPNSVLANTNRGVTLLKIGRLEDALKDLERALILDPDFSVTRLNLGTIYYLQGKLSAAIIELSKVIKSLPPGSQQGAAYLFRGKAYLDRGKLQKAIDDFTIAANHFLDSKPKAHCEFMRAIALLRNNNDLLAFQAIEASLKINDEFAEAHLFKAELYLRSSNTKLAFDEITKAIEFGKGDSITAQAYALRAKLFTKQGQHKQALTEYDHAVELDRNNPAIHHDRGVQLLFLEEYETAIEAFNLCLNLDSMNAGALNNRGIANALQGKINLAIEDHKRAVYLFKKSSEAGSPLRHLALCYAINGEIKLAIETVRKARNLDIESHFNDQVEGLIKLYQGKYEDSFSLISKVVSRHDEIPDLKLYQSLPMAFLGKVHEAISLAEECIGSLQIPFSKSQFITHTRALHNRFPNDEGFAIFYQSVTCT